MLSLYESQDSLLFHLPITVSFFLKANYSNNIQIYYGHYKVVHHKTLKFKRKCLNKEMTKQIMAETLGTEVRVGM